MAKQKQAKAKAKPAKAVKAKKPVKATKPAKATKAAKATPAGKSKKATKVAKVVKTIKVAKVVKAVKAASKSSGKKVPPRIVKRVASSAKPQTSEYKPIDTAKAVAFAMSIAEEMKRSAAQADADRAKEEIRLTRRPTTRSQGKATVKFPVSDLKEFKKRLLEARARAMSGASAMRETGFNASDDHEADGGDGTNQTLRLQALGQVGNMNRIIQQIEEALHRIEDGSYGVCTVCGQLIRKPRLLNQPFVLTCMECQSEMERVGR